MDEHFKQHFRGGGLRFFRGEVKPCRERSRRSSRRLITLIFAGLDIRMVMIRRELPRTRNAGWARRACRIKRMRVLLLADPSAAASTASLSRCDSVFIGGAVLSRCQLSLCRFDLYSNGPDESQHLSTDRRDDLRFVLPVRQQGPIYQSAPNAGTRLTKLHRVRRGYTGQR